MPKFGKKIDISGYLDLSFLPEESGKIPGNQPLGGFKSKNYSGQ
jgi:hypothetical protein